MKYFLFVFFLFFAMSVFAQSAEYPVVNIEVDSLKKKESDLWYVEKQPPKEYRNSSKTQMENDSTDAARRKLERQRISEMFNISPVVFEILKWLMYGLLLVGVIFLILKGNFSMSFKPRNSKITTIITETSTIESAEQLQTISYQDQITDAESLQNYRLAIRLYYLWALKKLIDKNLIIFHIRKTNRDYCQELKENQYYESFMKCTEYYNYVWFGEFNINDTIYQELKANFNQLLEKL
jgi:hypothetical protein